MISYLSTVSATTIGGSTFSESGRTTNGSFLTSYSSSGTTDMGGATVVSTSYQSGTISGFTSTATSDTTSGTTRASTVGTSDTYNAWGSASFFGSNYLQSTTTAAATGSNSGVLGVGFTMVAATDETSTAAKSGATTSVSTTNATTTSTTISSLSFITSSASNFSFSTVNTTGESGIWSTSFIGTITYPAFVGVSTATVARSSYSFQVTFTNTVTTSATSKVNIVYDTVVIPQTGTSAGRLYGEIVWVPTTDGSGLMNEVAMSHTDRFTIANSDFIGSSSYSFLSSTTTIATASVLTRSATTVTFTTVSSSGVTASVTASARQSYLGTFAIPEGVENYSEITTSSSTVVSASASAAFISSASVTNASTVRTTFTGITLSTIADDARAVDIWGTVDPEGSWVIPRRVGVMTYLSTTMVSSVTSRFFDAVGGTRSFSTASNRSAGGATGVTAVFASGQPTLFSATSGSHIHFGASTGKGFGSFQTAGSQSEVFRNIEATLGALDGLYFSFDRSLIARDGQSAIFTFTDTTHLFGVLSTNESDTLDNPVSASAQFLTTTSTESFTGATARMRITADHAGDVTVETITLSVNQGQVLSACNTTLGFGARQAIGGSSQTRFATTGPRYFSKLDSDGGITSGTTFRTIPETTTIPTAELWIESARLVVTAKTSTETPTAHVGTLLITSPLYISRFAANSPASIE